MYQNVSQNANMQQVQTCTEDAHNIANPTLEPRAYFKENLELPSSPAYIELI